MLTDKQKGELLKQAADAKKAGCNMLRVDGDIEAAEFLAENTTGLIIQHPGLFAKALWQNVPWWKRPILKLWWRIA